MDTHLKGLSLITDANLALFNTGGITELDDLRYLNYVNIQTLCVDSITMTGRKLERVASFIDWGGGDHRDHYHDGGCYNKSKSKRPIKLHHRYLYHKYTYGRPQ